MGRIPVLPQSGWRRYARRSRRSWARRACRRWRFDMRKHMRGAMERMRSTGMSERSARTLMQGWSVSVRRANRRQMPYGRPGRLKRAQKNRPAQEDRRKNTALQTQGKCRGRSRCRGISKMTKRSKAVILCISEKAMSPGWQNLRFTYRQASLRKQSDRRREAGGKRQTTPRMDRRETIVMF